MTPVSFLEANANFVAPPDMDEAQVRTIAAYVGVVRGGSVDGATVVVTAWQPTAAELEQLQAGKPVYLSVLGGLPPHFLTVDFQQAIQPA